MRELINKYAYYIVGMALAVSLLLVIFRGGGTSTSAGQDSNKRFYVDEETGEESVHSASEIPPLPGKSGKLTLVQAYKVTTDGGKTVTAYLKKYPDELRERLISMPDDDLHKSGLITYEYLVRLPGEGQEWVKSYSDKGRQILDFSTLGDGPIEPVWPK